MTSYDIAVPLFALAVTGVGILWIHIASRRLDARIDAHDAERLRKGRHPAE